MPLYRAVIPFRQNVTAPEARIIFEANSLTEAAMMADDYCRRKKEHDRPVKIEKLRGEAVDGH